MSALGDDGCRNGTFAHATDADLAARAAFEATWREYPPRRSEADFQAWRDQEAWTADKYRRIDRHRAHAGGLAAWCLSADR